jgi:hypothetical protein
MISVRLHLDSCDETNGALQVPSGSHRVGRIPDDQIPSILRDTTARVCSVNRGGASTWQGPIPQNGNPRLGAVAGSAVVYESGHRVSCEPLSRPGADWDRVPVTGTGDEENMM